MGNIGDEAILMGLKKFLSEKLPQPEITVMGNGSLFPFGLRSGLRSFINWNLWIKPLRMMRSSDLFILGGGGLFTDEEAWFVPAFWALHGLMAAVYGKPVFCVGVSVHELVGINKWLTKMLFSLAKYVMVRDLPSHKILSEWGIQSVLGSDLSLFLSKPPGGVECTEKYAVAVFRDFHNFSENMYKKVAQLLDSITVNYGLKIKFLTFQAAYKNDSAVLYKIFDLSDKKEKLEILGAELNTAMIIEIFGQAEFVIAMRLHAGILALVTETPFFPISYMSKVSSFWSEFGSIDVSEFNEDGLDKLHGFIVQSLPSRAESIARLTGIKSVLANRLSCAGELLISALQK